MGQKELTFEVNSYIPGTNIHTEVTFKATVTVYELRTVIVATNTALCSFIGPEASQALAEAIISKLFTVTSNRASVIQEGNTANGTGTYRVLAKAVS